jgi:hypothetical protein
MITRFFNVYFTSGKGSIGVMVVENILNEEPVCREFRRTGSDRM